MSATLTSEFLPVRVDEELYSALAQVLERGIGIGGDGMHWPSTMRRVDHLMQNRPDWLSREDAELLRQVCDRYRSAREDGVFKASFFVRMRAARAAIQRMLG